MWPGQRAKAKLKGAALMAGKGALAAKGKAKYQVAPGPVTEPVVAAEAFRMGPTAA